MTRNEGQRVSADCFEGQVVDRRLRRQSGDESTVVPCRICREWITLRLERLELLQNCVLHPCPRCGSRSLIRVTDLHLLLKSSSGVTEGAVD